MGNPDQNTNEMRKHKIMRWILLSIPVASLIIMALCCAPKYTTDRKKNDVAPLTLRLNNQELTSLGRMQGPYKFSEAVTPSLVQLIDMQDHEEMFKLIGLCDYEYPVADMSTQRSGNKQSSIDVEVLKTRMFHIQDAKKQALKDLCGDHLLWLVRMSDTNPSMIYLFMPSKKQKNHNKLSGPTQLVNASILRMGLANMELQGVRHPLFDWMIECQLYAIIQSQRNTEMTQSLWTEYEMQMPMEDYEQLMTDIEMNI